jgi:hypothetical protein
VALVMVEALVIAMVMTRVMATIDIQTHYYETF